MRLDPKGRLKLAFVSTVFLLPADAGGKIRTGNVLRGLKGGTFEITLISPAPVDDTARWRDGLALLADHVVLWPAPAAAPRWTRALDLVRDAPANVCHGVTRQAKDCVAQTLALGGFDLVVFDFVHATALMPPDLPMATLCFTHNVEAEIFARHAQQATSPWWRWIWNSQATKMARYERNALARYTSVIAVSERDVKLFAAQAGRDDVEAIPTAVDLEFFSWQPPRSDGQTKPARVVFTGSMDWAANIDGVGWLLAEIWPLVLQQVPDAELTVVGRSPPAALVRQAAVYPGVKFTGFVDDVRPHVRGAQVFTMPLRVGGGTRIKAFEAMAMGCPVVSTSLGVEGLDVLDGVHLLQRDSAEAQAKAIVGLLSDLQARQALSEAARALVEQRFGHLAAAQVFESICVRAVERMDQGGRPRLAAVSADPLRQPMAAR